MSTKPLALRPGDLIGVAAPAGAVSEERLWRGKAELEALGFAVRIADGVLERSAFAAGSAEQRLRQLHGLFCDPEVKAIVCARGGAGAVHLLPLLDRELLRANPKPLVGYSDITALHQALGQLGLMSLHGPMAARELADGPLAYDRASLWHALTGEGEPWQSGAGDLVPLRSGEAEGILRGGCLSLLAALAGTPWALAGSGEPRLLLLEDVGEPPYRVDRMLRQLRLAGGFEGVGGIVFGALPGCAAGETEGYSLEGVVLEALAGLEVPVAWGLASGHTTGPNLTLPLGVRARLRCEDGHASLTVLEAAVR